MWSALPSQNPPAALFLTAHYDHVGTGRCDGSARGFLDSQNPGDWIWNGANDNASGVASMLEVVQSIVHVGKRFRHSIVFAAFCGEELGLFGSSWYVDHPLVPLSRTLGQINLEQTGRIDDPYRPGEVARGTPSMTGYGYSSMTQTVEHAAANQKIGLYRHPYLSDMLFLSSDNAHFALGGVPAHTVCLAYQYSDYHGAGDHADQLDYVSTENFNRNEKFK